MKKITTLFILILSLSLLIFSSSISAAPAPGKLHPNQLALGGIHLGDSIDYVKSIYGKPRIARFNNNNPAYYEYDYGNGLLIKFWNESNPKDVVDILVSERNGFATPAGIEVGMDADILLKLYGKPDAHHARNVIHYWTYYSSENSMQYLQFTIMTEKITEIKLHWSE